MASEPDKQKLERNVGNTLALAFFQVFMVIIPVAVPFFQSRGLSMQDVLLLQALFAVVVLVSEVPSGYAADLLGRKWTLVVGAVFAGIGHSLLLVAHDFWSLAAFEIALGISGSLISGADIALLYDSEAALGRPEQAQRQVVGRLYGVRTFSEAIAGVVCSILLLWSMELAVYVQAAVGWIPLVLALRLQEPPGTRLSQTGHVANMGRIFGYLANHSRVLVLTMLALCIWSLTTFYAFWFLQRLWQEQGVALSNFGYLLAALSVLAALAGRWAHVVEERLGTSGALLLIGVAPVLGYMGLALFGPVGAYLTSATFFVARGVGLVILRDALNRRVPAEYRATANSLASFGFRGAFALTAPLIGQVFDLWGMGTTLWLLAVASLVIFVVLIVPLLLAARAQTLLPRAPA
ncbi:MAG: MFS transporter [Pseudomonadales bacterium]